MKLHDTCGMNNKTPNQGYPLAAAHHEFPGICRLARNQHGSRELRVAVAIFQFAEAAINVQQFQ